MAILTKPSFAPSTSLIYITVGALLDAWTAVYYFAFGNNVSPEARPTLLFWLAGLFLTGLILVALGFALGPIGRAARQAEMPPPEVTPQAAQAEMDAAAAPVVVPPAATATTPVVKATTAAHTAGRNGP